MHPSVRTFLSCSCTHLLLLLVVVLLALLFPTTVLSRRLCGQVLTSELKRVCTKEGMKGPCLHGANNFAAVQKRATPLNFGLWRPLDHHLDGASKTTNFRNFFDWDLMVNNRRWGGDGVFGRRSPMFGGDSQGIVRPFRKFKDDDDNNNNDYGLPMYSRLKRPRGIVDKCCSAEGCDAAFLDSFCCDEMEEKTFRATHQF